jgi:hypothetical protein
MSQPPELYDTDFYVWTKAQATALRDGNLAALDLGNLAEEIESLGKRDRRALVSQLERLLLHLLKWQYHPSMRQTGSSWRQSIRQARREMALIINDSPSLERQVPIQLAFAYAHARVDASDETGLPLALFPEVCPWDVAQVVDANFFPEDEAHA